MAGLRLGTGSPASGRRTDHDVALPRFPYYTVLTTSVRHGETLTNPPFFVRSETWTWTHCGPSTKLLFNVITAESVLGQLSWPGVRRIIASPPPSPPCRSGYIASHQHRLLGLPAFRTVLLVAWPLLSSGNVLFLSSGTGVHSSVLRNYSDLTSAQSLNELLTA
jgi:hypothetical protein